MANDPDDTNAAYKAALPPSFFTNTAATDARKQHERKLGRTIGERGRTKQRAVVRTEHIGIRTTPEFRKLIKTLADRLKLETATEVIERALLDLDESTQSDRPGR